MGLQNVFLELSSEVKEIICLQVDESEGDEAEAERKSCQDTLLEELHQDSLRKRWARQEAINATKKDIHYQDILFDGGYIFVDLCYYETLSFFASSFFISCTDSLLLAHYLFFFSSACE